MYCRLNQEAIVGIMNEGMRMTSIIGEMHLRGGGIIRDTMIVVVGIMRRRRLRRGIIIMADPSILIQVTMMEETRILPTILKRIPLMIPTQIQDAPPPPPPIASLPIRIIYQIYSMDQ